MPPLHDPIGRGLLVMVLTGCVATAASHSPEARRPDSDSEVVAILRSGGASSGERELRHLRQLAADPGADPAVILATTRRCLERHRETADPRYLGAAIATLGAGWSRPDADPEVRVLRATIRQSLHEFDAAEQELAAALSQDPRHVPAWLLLANIQCVRGHLNAARHSALQLARLADPLTATTIAAQIASLSGKSGSACTALETALDREGPGTEIPTRERAVLRHWALSVLAEARERLGQPDDAGRAYRRALESGPADPYLLGTYADFLLDHGRSQEVPGLLRGWETVDALALRMAEATRDPEQVARLARRFDAARASGERLHLREAARFELRLRGDSAAALILALDNWKVQREPADFRILAEAAVAAGNAQAIAEAASWFRDREIEGTPPALAAVLASAAVPHVR